MRKFRVWIFSWVESSLDVNELRTLPEEGSDC